MRYAVAIAAIVLVTLGVGRVATGTETAKIGVVSVTRVYEESKYKSEYERILSGLFKKVQAEVDGRRQKIVAMKSEMFLYSDEHRKEKQEEITAEENNLKRYAAEAQEKLNRQKVAFLQEFEKKATAIVEVVATEQELDLVVNSAMVIYNKDAKDLTDTVLEKLNELFDKEHAEDGSGTTSETDSETASDTSD